MAGSVVWIVAEGERDWDRFSFHADGSISDLRVVSSTLNDLSRILCLRAVRDDLAPFALWPETMRQIVKTDGAKFNLPFITINYRSRSSCRYFPTRHPRSAPAHFHWAHLIRPREWQ